jgi:hypothetical protein
LRISTSPLVKCPMNNLHISTTASFPDLIGESNLFTAFWIVRSSRTMTINLWDITLATMQLALHGKAVILAIKGEI